MFARDDFRVLCLHCQQQHPKPSAQTALISGQDFCCREEEVLWQGNSLVTAKQLARPPNKELLVELGLGSTSQTAGSKNSKIYKVTPVSHGRNLGPLSVCGTASVISRLTGQLKRSSRQCEERQEDLSSWFGTPLTLQLAGFDPIPQSITLNQLNIIRDHFWVGSGA